MSKSGRKITETMETRFWKYVKKTKTCWIWQGTHGKFGHGNLRYTSPSKKTIGAHRYSWMLANGPIPEGMFVCHNCPEGDNPACVNPAHLFVGTQKDNLHDMLRKRRHWLQNKGHLVRGDKNQNSKLTWKNVLDIRNLLKAGKRVPDIAKFYSVTRECIYAIRKNKTWQQQDQTKV